MSHSATKKPVTRRWAVTLPDSQRQEHRVNVLAEDAAGAVAEGVYAVEFIGTRRTGIRAESVVSVDVSR